MGKYTLWAVPKITIPYLYGTEAGSIDVYHHAPVNGPAGLMRTLFMLYG
jgi:hypothetical protein